MKFKAIILLILGVWLGMILGISFLEAPLKFKAPNITLPLGLGIGRLVFSALNKIEIIFSIFMIAAIGYQYKQMETQSLLVFIILIALIVLQSLWLLPILDSRADQILQGIEVGKSNHHFYYIATELAKVGVLIYGFVKIYHHE